MEHMAEWTRHKRAEGGSGSTSGSAAASSSSLMDGETLHVNMFVELQQALVLQQEEMEVLVEKVADALRHRFRLWHLPSHLRACAEDECCLCWGRGRPQDEPALPHILRKQILENLVQEVRVF